MSKSNPLSLKPLDYKEAVSALLRVKPEEKQKPINHPKKKRN
jgi:hypothetical protein